MASTKQMQARAKAARKAANKPKREAKVISYAFFYSPTDSVDDVLAITCSNFQGLPLEVGKIAWDEKNLSLHDEEFKKDPSVVLEMFSNLEAVRAYVCSRPGQMVDITEVNDDFDMPMGNVLGLMASNIAWLTTRGHLKQSEYNGTLVVTGLGERRATPNA